MNVVSEIARVFLVFLRNGSAEVRGTLLILQELATVNAGAVKQALTLSS